MYGVVSSAREIEAEEAARKANKDRTREAKEKLTSEFEQRITRVTSVLIRSEGSKMLPFPIDGIDSTAGLYSDLLALLLTEKVSRKSREIHFYGYGWCGWYCELVERNSGGVSFLFDNKYRVPGDKKQIALSQFFEHNLKLGNDGNLMQSVLVILNQVNAPKAPPDIQQHITGSIVDDISRNVATHGGPNLQVVWHQRDECKMPLLMSPERMLNLMAKKILETQDWEPVAGFLYCSASSERVLEESAANMLDAVRRMAQDQIESKDLMEGLDKLDAIYDNAISMARERYGLLYAVAMGVGAYKLTGKAIFANNLTIDLFRYVADDSYAFESGLEWKPRHPFLKDSLWIVSQTTFRSGFSGYPGISHELDRIFAPLISKMNLSLAALAGRN